jgi:hypothetical protein
LLAQQPELFIRIIDTLAFDACRTHQPGNGLAMLGYQHFLTRGYSVEKARKVRLCRKSSHRNHRWHQNRLVEQFNQFCHLASRSSVKPGTHEVWVPQKLAIFLQVPSELSGSGWGGDSVLQS